MNPSLQALFQTMLNKKIIGAKHTPEQKIKLKKTKWVDKKQKKEFEKSYKEAIKKEFILRTKKRTKKDYDWHISLNPRELKNILEMIDDD